MIFWGSIADLPLVWNLADLFMAFMVLTNVTAILLLFPQVRTCLKDYEDQLAKGIKLPISTRKYSRTRRVSYGGMTRTTSTALRNNAVPIILNKHLKRTAQ